jgi:hypothetical protein
MIERRWSFLVAHLVAEDRARADAGAVGLGHAFVEDALQEIEISLHGLVYGRSWPAFPIQNGAGTETIRREGAGANGMIGS